jgi:hypothetical protein
MIASGDSPAKVSPEAPESRIARARERIAALVGLLEATAA